MAKVNPIILKVEDNEYTLEFNRESIVFAEQRGFNVEDVVKFPMKLYDFFFLAFRMHHKNVDKYHTDKIINDYFGGISKMPENVITRLAELWEQGYQTLTDEEIESKKELWSVQL